MVRQWVLVPPFEGSNPSALAKIKKITRRVIFFILIKDEGSAIRVRTEERSDDVHILPPSAEPSSFRPQRSRHLPPSKKAQNTLRLLFYSIVMSPPNFGPYFPLVTTAYVPGSKSEAEYSMLPSSDVTKPTDVAF